MCDAGVVAVGVVVVDAGMDGGIVFGELVASGVGRWAWLLLYKASQSCHCLPILLKSLFN